MFVIEDFKNEITEFLNEYLIVKDVQVMSGYVVVSFDFSANIHFLFSKELKGILKICQKYSFELSGIDFDSYTFYFKGGI